jgi:hypothetical protein
MASTYSSLKFELIGTGDQAGTWGATTNTNIGTAIQEAITGSASVTFSSSNVAIALTDTNASQTARNLRLALSGTITNAQYLFVPAVAKQYLINNGLSNTVIVSNGSNGAATGSTVSIPAGKSVIVFNSGTNVAEAVNYSADFTAANVTLSTALSVSSGGSGRANLTANSVILGNNTSAVNFVAPGTSGNVLTSNGTTWVSQAPSITIGKSIAMVIVFG